MCTFIWNNFRGNLTHVKIVVLGSFAYGMGIICDGRLKKVIFSWNFPNMFAIARNIQKPSRVWGVILVRLFVNSINLIHIFIAGHFIACTCCRGQRVSMPRNSSCGIRKWTLLHQIIQTKGRNRGFRDWLQITKIICFQSSSLDKIPGLSLPFKSAKIGQNPNYVVAVRAIEAVLTFIRVFGIKFIGMTVLPNRFIRWEVNQ